MARSAHLTNNQLAAFASDSLSTEEDLFVDDHLATCASCRARICGEDSIIDANRSFPRMSVKYYQTDDGVVQVWAERSFGLWTGRVEGPTFTSRRVATNQEEALTEAQKVLHQAFPETIIW